MRLIDSGLLLSNLSGRLKNMEDYDAALDVVNNMPTAYDVNKVIGQLAQLAEYEKMGTVEECREAREKERPKTPYIWGDGCDDEGNMIYDMYDCPGCGKSYETDDKYKHCPECGQTIDWRGYENL